MSFHSELIDLLKTDPRFVGDDGELILAAVQDAAWKIDRALVKLLLSDKAIKAKFFDEIEGHWIFNINTFLEYISQKNFLDNSYTRFRNRIGLTIDGKYLRERGEVALVWPYKDAVLEGGQTKEEEKRREIFFNEVLAQDEINRLLDPKVLTNFVRYTAKGKEKVTGFRRDESGVIRENLIIKGNNLLALHTLKTQFRGRVKLIYIDPPYNTGNDSFGYNDSFSHSTWLTFMKNRLEAARVLLQEDGSIWINIDDNEAHYLKVLCDDIFGREGFLGCAVWQHSIQGKGYAGKFSIHHNYLMCYQKTVEFNLGLLERTSEHNRNYANPDNDPRGDWRTGDIRNSLYRPNLIYDVGTPSGKVIKPPTNGWRFSKETMENKIRDGSVIFSKDETRLILKIYLADQQGRVPESIWFGKDVGTTRDGNKEIKELFGEKVFETPKPESLIKRIFEIGTEEGDIVLDFQLGSGTTAAVAHKMGRQYIGIEQMDYIESIPVERLKKVIAGEQGGISKAVNWQGGGDFIYCELMKYNEAFMERIQAAQDSEELLDIWQEMAEDSFLNWYVNPAMPEEAVRDFEALGREPNGLEKQKKLLAELLDKNQLYVNLSEIDDAQFKVSEEDKALNRAFYGEETVHE